MKFMKFTMSNSDVESTELVFEKRLKENDAPNCGQSHHLKVKTANNKVAGVELDQARHYATSRARKRVGEIKWRLRHRFQRLK